MEKLKNGFTGFSFNIKHWPIKGNRVHYNNYKPGVIILAVPEGLDEKFLSIDYWTSVTHQQNKQMKDKYCPLNSVWLKWLGASVQWDISSELHEGLKTL